MDPHAVGDAPPRGFVCQPLAQRRDEPVVQLDQIERIAGPIRGDDLLGRRRPCPGPTSSSRRGRPSPAA